MANEEVLGPRKTIFVLVTVVGCFAVLWPRILSPLMLGPSREQLKPNRFDREAGCCEVIFETELQILELLNEVCNSVVHVHGRLSPYAAAQCRTTVNETCGLDIADFLKRSDNVGKTSKMLVEIMKNSNSSCLKEHFGVPVWNLGSHLALNSWTQQDMLKQERSPIRGTGAHPALRERGRAIPATPPLSQGSVVMPPHARVRTSPLSVYFELDIKPPPIPGMRPPLGSPGGPVPTPKSSMGFVMPVYTICIIVFFVYTLSKILFKRTGASPYETVVPDPQFRRRVFRDDSRTSPDKLVVTAISGLVAEVQQQMEANHAQNQQRQDVQDNHTRSYTNGTILHNSGPVHIVASEYCETTMEKSLESQRETDSYPFREESGMTVEREEFVPKSEAAVEIENLLDSVVDTEDQVLEPIKIETEKFVQESKEAKLENEKSVELTELKSDLLEVDVQESTLESKKITPIEETVLNDNEDIVETDLMQLESDANEIDLDNYQNLSTEGKQPAEFTEEPEELTKEIKENVQEPKEAKLENEKSVELKELIKEIENDVQVHTSEVKEFTLVEEAILDDDKDIVEKDLTQLKSGEDEKEASPEPEIVKTNHEEELFNLTDDINVTKSQDARLTEEFLKEELKGSESTQEKQSTPELLEEAIKDEVIENDETDGQENASVKVVGMEVTTHSADGGACPTAPPTTAPVPRRVHEAEDVKSIFLETEIPQQSRVLVADFAEDTADKPPPTRHSPMVVSGKMTLSLIQDAPRDTPEREPESTVDEFTTASALTQNAAEQTGEEPSDEEIEEEIEIEEIEEEIEDEQEEEELDPKKDKSGLRLTQ